MQTKKTIAIIGAAGSMGSAISKSLSKGNYRLLLCSPDYAKVQALSQEITQTNPGADVDALDCSVIAGWEADIIILAVPYDAEKEIVSKIKDVANQKIVISIANPMNDTYDGL